MRCAGGPATSSRQGQSASIFCHVRNMTQGVLWRRELYRDRSCRGPSYLWGFPTEGRTSFCLGMTPALRPEASRSGCTWRPPTPISRMNFTIDAPDTE
jgi:hypothetical protein